MEAIAIPAISAFLIVTSYKRGTQDFFPIPDSLGALTVVELNSPRVAPLPTPYSLVFSSFVVRDRI
ncbi:MAG: hypothetical protein F6K63_17915 [Moorea sp. SIO1G6]|uniref:hypothetical protein n=1 Tax=Moorena sp. SIO1G6 TaxID=2607840 RepID=UPI0013BEC788|nr:hypothetical protein [Moorena sp. SIO1G6]NET66157.1 hypothetical protein [Moorena sp. SIO1G6]